MKKIILSFILCIFAIPVYAIDQELGEIRLNFSNNNSSGIRNINVQSTMPPDVEKMAESFFENMIEAIKTMNPNDAKETIIKLKENLDNKNANITELYDGYSALGFMGMGLFEADSPHLIAITSRMSGAIKKRPNNEIIAQGVSKEKFISDVKKSLDVYFTQSVKDKRITYLYNNGLLEYVLGNYETGKKFLYPTCNKYTGKDREWCLNYIETLIKETESEKLDITPFIEAINSIKRN